METWRKLLNSLSEALANGSSRFSAGELALFAAAGTVLIWFTIKLLLAVIQRKAGKYDLFKDSGVLSCLDAGTHVRDGQPHHRSTRSVARSRFFSKSRRPRNLAGSSPYRTRASSSTTRARSAYLASPSTVAR